MDALAADQRLQPHLHARMRRGAICQFVPDAIAARWQAAHRAAALAALVQRRDILKAAATLRTAGVDAIALKGGWLAWTVYPDPAERVLRDLDLLVRESDAPRALAALLAAGMEAIEALPDDPADHAVSHKELAVLATEAGTIVELHSHAWEPPGSLEWPTPPLADERLFAHSVRDRDSGLLALSAQDMLAHLAIHAAYSHRFEVGPLILADVDYLLREHPLDWPAFWDAAETGRFARGAALTLALVDRWRLPGLIERSACPLPVDDLAIDHASRLLLQPSGQRRDTRSLAAIRQVHAAEGIAKAAALGFARLGKTMHDPAHMLRRLGDTARALRDPAIARAAESSQMVGDWLDG